ncbi:MAG TPA: hypothetical protein VNE17_07305 [Nitrolancea sp.]|nr:hypothetical protein [Nitrolancea sp.]
MVAARQHNLIVTSFHPELTSDDRLHRWFAQLAVDAANQSVQATDAA